MMIPTGSIWFLNLMILCRILKPTLYFKTNLKTNLEEYWNRLIQKEDRELKIGMTEDVCDFCKGVGSSSTNVCVYCNGTGEWNQAAQSYVKNHICQCIVLDRKFCPVCNKPCHHDTSLNPKQTIDSGHGGMSVPGIPM